MLFCRVLLLFRVSFASNHGQGSQQHDCAFKFRVVSVLEEYPGPMRPSWLAQEDSKMIDERKNNQ